MMSSETSRPRSDVRPAPAQTNGPVTPHVPVWHQRFIARLIWLIEWVVTATIRFRVRNGAGPKDCVPPGPSLFCIWHNRLALSMWLYFSLIRKNMPDARLAALISASKDGALLAAILERFGVQPVRGSSSRRGPQALLELTTWAERGYDLAITPDGPRGPRYEIQPGIMSLAQVTGRPVVPVSFHLRWKITLKSWDRFQIPLPFTICEIAMGRPITVPRDVTDEQRAALRLRLLEEMRAITRDD